MFKDKFVFSQIVSFLDRNKFNHIVRKYGGDKYVKHFTCWNQLLCLMFGQLSNRASLRDLIVALEAHRGKLYHLGLGKNVSKTNLAKSNQERDYRIFELRSTRTFLLMKLNASVLPTFSNSVVTSMPLTPQL